jgi:hypothetical protein
VGPDRVHLDGLPLALGSHGGPYRAPRASRGAVVSAAERIEWRLAGKGGRALILSERTTADFWLDPKVERQVRADAAILAAVKRDAIDVVGSDGSRLATVEVQS